MLKIHLPFDLEIVLGTCFKEYHTRTQDIYVYGCESMYSTQNYLL